MNDESRYGWISVRNNYTWNGPNPRAAIITIAIDHRRKGWVQIEDTEKIPVYPGVHTVRVTLFLWYRSPAVEVTVSPGSTVSMRADMPRNGSLFIRMLRGAFRPFHWLVLEEIGDGCDNALRE